MERPLGSLFTVEVRKCSIFDDGMSTDPSLSDSALCRTPVIVPFSSVKNRSIVHWARGASLRIP